MQINFLSKSLKNKLIFSHIIAVIVVTILIEVIIYYISVSMQMKDAKNFDEQMVKQINNSLDSMITSFKRVCNYVSMDRELQELIKTGSTDNTDRYHQYTVENILQSITVDKTIFINELDSLYLYDKHSLRGHFKRYYTQPKETTFSSIPDPSRFSPDGKVTWRVDGNTVSFNRAIRDLDSLEVIGYLIMTMNQNYIENKINAIRSNQNRFIIITDEFDNIIVHNYRQNEEKLYDILKSIQRTADIENRVQNIEFIGKSLITMHQSDYSKWKIISVISVSELTKGPGVMARWIYYIGIFGILIGVAISLFSSNKLVKPLNSLTYMMDEVENENFDVRVKVNSDDELGRLEYSFNKMVDKINNLIYTVYQEEIKYKNAELKALQAQINPHFLYNTLDCINWLAEFGKTNEIRSVTIALASLMKASANNKQKMVTVEGELNYIKAYLSIYKISLQEKFRYYIEMDESILNVCIPKLILQPLVENAILHGLKKKIGQGNLHIKGFREENKIVFQIFDDGVGMENGQVTHVLNSTSTHRKNMMPGTGSGLKNVKDRIQLIYGDGYGLHIESEKGLGTVVEVTMPIQKKGDEENVQSFDH